jgi:hypothetical protein
MLRKLIRPLGQIDVNMFLINRPSEMRTRTTSYGLVHNSLELAY